jgi:hypothetical protein
VTPPGAEKAARKISAKPNPILDAASFRSKRRTLKLFSKAVKINRII